MVIFQVLTLVDGESVKIRSKNNPDIYYLQNFLDVIVVPAVMGEYIIENLGDQPVCIHKTMIKEEFYEEE